MSWIYRSGIGYDVHKLVEGRKCILGGVDIPHSHGLLGHSDADVLVHAIADSILGAMGIGDIGRFFPDNDPQFKGLDSLKILEFIREKISEMDMELVFIDSVLMAQKPKILPHIDAMKQNIAQALGIKVAQVGIKGTTTEKLGFVGREEGLASQAVATIRIQENF